MKILVLLMILVMMFGCDLEPDIEDIEDVKVVEDYQTFAEYEAMLVELGQLSVVVKSDIVAIMDTQDVGVAEYTFYQSGSYICYGFHWDHFNDDTYEWDYYVSVDVWTVDGVLKLSMCSYYN